MSMTKPNQSSIIIIHSLFIILLLLFISSKTRATQQQLAPALYVFGDSLLDSGNNNFLQTIARSNYLPYGIDFASKSTGRFTNGKTVADFIAEFLGLPYSPPCLSFNDRDSLPLTGLNYASASCGLLPETGTQFGQCLSFEEQVELFRNSVETLKQQQRHFERSVELSNYLSKSIFIISVGSNDYLNNYTTTTNNYAVTSSLDTNRLYAQHLVDNLSLQLQRLYKLGARKIVMFEIGPIGCIPAIAGGKSNNDGGKCVEDVNQFVSYFNSRMTGMLQKLRSSLKGSTIVIGHAFAQAHDVIINPSKYGLINSSSPCCLTMPVAPLVCLPLPLACDNDDKFYFWDAYHPTQAVFSQLASLCINDASFCAPFSLKELVQI